MLDEGRIGDPQRLPFFAGREGVKQTFPTAALSQNRTLFGGLVDA